MTRLHLFEWEDQPWLPRVLRDYGQRYPDVLLSLDENSTQALAAGGMGDRKAKFEPMAGEFLHVAQPNCYRCPFALSYPSCNLACVKNLENTIQEIGRAHV